MWGQTRGDGQESQGIPIAGIPDLCEERWFDEGSDDDREVANRFPIQLETNVLDPTFCAG